MKPVPTQVLSDLSGRFGYDSGQLTQIGGGRGDSDGIVYGVQRGEEAYVLKVVGGRAKDPGLGINIRARAAFFAFLGEQGIEVVSPRPNEAGTLVEIALDGEDAFLAYTYPYLAGQHPEPEAWTDEMLTAWGRTIGAAHRAAKAYPIWEGMPSPVDGTMLLSWQREMDGFAEWCKDEEMKAYWGTLRGRLNALAHTRDTAGFIHNDPHMQNILFDQDRVKLIDFDVATCHFFACDLAIAIQSVLFTHGGGLDRPVSDQAAINWFTGRLLEGYAQENDLNGDILGSIELFIGYRRALLYTVMEGWLNENPPIKASWKRMTLGEAKVLQLG